MSQSSIVQSIMSIILPSKKSNLWIVIQLTATAKSHIAHHWVNNFLKHLCQLRKIQILIM